MEVSVCRVCMISSDVFEYYNLMDKQIFKNIRLCDAFKLITGLVISDNDEFPKMICFRCEQQLQSAFHFRQLACSSSKHFATIRVRNLPRILNLSQKTYNQKVGDVTLKSGIAADEDKTTTCTSTVVYNYTVDINGDDDHIEVRPKETSESRSSRSTSTKHLTATANCDVRPDEVEVTYESDNDHDEHSDSDAISFLINNRHLKKDDNNDPKSVAYNNRKYECTVCTKKFVGKSNLVDHLRYHANIRNFNCTVCDKSFVQSGSLKSHLRTHTAERPYTCTFCDKRFGQKSALTVHIRTHTNERKFVCQTCSKAFMTTGDLVKHKLIHEKIKKFACDVPGCGMRSAQKVNIKKHRLNVHGLPEDKLSSSNEKECHS